MDLVMFISWYLFLFFRHFVFLFDDFGQRIFAKSNWLASLSDPLILH
jgi:hypothetical protein